MTGVTLASREEVDAGTVVTTAHAQISFLRLLDPAVLPPEFVAEIKAWQTRSGTVKINLALDRLPVFPSVPAFDPQVHGGTIVLAESLDDLATAFQEAAYGRPSALPFAAEAEKAGLVVNGSQPALHRLISSRHRPAAS